MARQAVGQRFQYRPHVDLLFELSAGLQKGLQCGQMELVRKDLDDAVHEIRLGNGILATQYLF